MKINPVIVGRGAAGQAMQRSLAIVSTIHQQLSIAPAIFAERNAPLSEIAQNLEHPVLLIANPHALHSKGILEGSEAGFKALIVEKPACTSMSQVGELRKVKMPISVCHGYRMMWGPQTIREMLVGGEVGDIIAIEGRYWQSSAAQRAIEKSASSTWKNDPSLSGPYDVLLDLGSHWADMAMFLYGEKPERSRLWLSYLNSEAAHRDTHIHFDMAFKAGHPARASISKTAHGYGNDLELHVLGTKKSLGWHSQNPDVIEIGQGRDRTIKVREKSVLGSGMRAFHALGWLEGYVEIISQTLLAMAGFESRHVPTLQEGLDVVEVLLNAERG